MTEQTIWRTLPQEFVPAVSALLDERDALRAKLATIAAQERERCAAEEAIPVSEIEAAISHIQQNGIAVAKYGGEHADEGRCRELCAMYLEEFIVTLRMQQKLVAIRTLPDLVDLAAALKGD